MRWRLRAALGTLPNKDKNAKFAFNFFVYGIQLVAGRTSDPV